MLDDLGGVKKVTQNLIFKSFIYFINHIKRRDEDNED